MSQIKKLGNFWLEKEQKNREERELRQGNQEYYAIYYVECLVHSTVAQRSLMVLYITLYSEHRAAYRGMRTLGE
jgi:hypothetical protein